ncbi:Clavaminate synthase-like protein [Tothia fuscella]|uniref:Clavaminate synthase-like protein n=1 Tax=Tothia fuscella TaxID=1048955 RepID=A0A9P4NSV7_9PEZI|nr:Clavaminate synthase-like protein [Tothia fuscella]
MSPDLREEKFPGIPPFPDSVHTAPLLRISLYKLLLQDPTEQDQLWRACCDLGFFYLDLRLSLANKNLYKSSSNLEVDGPLFSQMQTGCSLLEKSYFSYRLKRNSGMNLPATYKGLGSGVLDKSGAKDRIEFYNVSKDDILGISNALPAPAMLNNHKPVLRSYIQTSHSLISLILGVLNKRLQLPESRLQGLHRLKAASGDQVRFLRAPPQPKEDRGTALEGHTDFGSITVLFNKMGGLQVRLPAGIEPIPPSRSNSLDTIEQLHGENGDGEKWVYVRPLPGHAIINLGDAMVKFSGGILRSDIHRVVSPPGAQAGTTRFSLVYFSRPEDKVMLGALKESPLIAQSAGDEPEEVINSRTGY